MAKKVRWPFSGTENGKDWQARRTREEIIVQVFKPGDPSKVAEWYMPRVLGVEAAAAQAVIQTGPENYQ